MSKLKLTTYMLQRALFAQVLQPIQFSLDLSFFFLQNIIETIKAWRWLNTWLTWLIGHTPVTELELRNTGNVWPPSHHPHQSTLQVKSYEPGIIAIFQKLQKRFAPNLFDQPPNQPINKTNHAVTPMCSLQIWYLGGIKKPNKIQNLGL